MGFNNCYLPNLNELTEFYNKFGLEVLYNRFRKYDCWTGDSDAMNYLENKIKEYEEVINNIGNTNNNRM